MDYATLNSMSPESFLNPESFVTPLDSMSIGVTQFQKGLEESRRALTVFICANGTWASELKPERVGNSTVTGHVTSYEGIGYHANTAELLRGFLAGPAPIVVARRDGSKTEIKPRTGD